MTYSPWGDAAERHPGIHIERCDIAPIRGAWVPSERVILLDSSLGRRGRRSVLAHEVAHVDLEHTPADDQWFDDRMERDADYLAATRLVEMPALLDALKWAEEMEEVAQDLGITLEVLYTRLDGMSDLERKMVADLAHQIEGGV